MAKRLTWYILAGLLLGGALGWALHVHYDDAGGPGTKQLADIAKNISLITFVFLRLIKMILAPLVFSTLVVGIAHMGDSAALGRIGIRSLLWFVCASLISLTLGLCLVHLLHPGLTLHTAGMAAPTGAPIAPYVFDAQKFIEHVIPASIVDAMATNEILEIVVFSIFFGVALTAVGEKAAPVVRGLEGVVKAMLQVTDYVMRFAPFAVFAAAASALALHGPDVIGGLARFMGSVYLGLACLWFILLFAAFTVIGRGVFRLIRYLREPIILGFTTASSEAAFPRTLEALERFGVPSKIASFVLPLGYSFNLDGSMMYMTFASLTIAEAYGIPLTLGQQVTMLLVLMLTSKGIAGVPRASLVVIAGTLSMFGIPEAGLLLILAVDQFLDMGRTATNVIGNAVASVVVARWEGQLEVPEPAGIEPPHAAPPLQA
jgi:Na+/H+-dicarboxylate symporter